MGAGGGVPAPRRRPASAGVADETTCVRTVADRRVSARTAQLRPRLVPMRGAAVNDVAAGWRVGRWGRSESRARLLRAAG